MKRPSPPLAAITFAALLGAILFTALPALAQPILTITPITWNVVGLDSNDVTTGPNNFPVGARVCNTGDTDATNVTSAFVWDTANALIDLRPGSKTSYTGADAVATLAAGACHDFYYEVQITRSASAYDQTRRYHITATADTLGTSSTTTPREIFVERLISQSRNSTDDVKLDTVSVPPGGTMTLVVGGTYNIELIASTATNGYEQIESFINFPNTIFQVNSVTATYSANGGTDPDALTKLYADGCSWENDPNSPNYRSCLSTGKYGGNVTLNYNVTIIGGGGTSQTLNTLIYDFSGSSYHYNSDFATGSRIAAIIDPTATTISKSFAPDPTIVGGTSTLTFTISNPNAAAISDLNFSDTFPTSPGAMVVANPTGASTTGCGTPTFAPVAGASSISFSGGTVAANSSCIVSLNVTVPTVGTYNNTSDNLFVGATDTGNNASDSLTVGTESVPSPVCGLVMAQWNFTGITNPVGFPTPSSQAADVGTAAISVGGSIPAIVTLDADSTSGNPAESLRMFGWQNAGPVVITTSPFIQFEIDTSNYEQVELIFDLERKANGPDSEELYFSTDGSSWTKKGATFSATTTWASYGTFNFTGETNTTGTTFFRLYGFGANTPSSGADLNIDNVSFTGCGVPNPPTLTKSFSPDPVAVNDTSTLSFTVTNPNAAVALSAIAFSDTLPAGVTVATSGPTTTCGGSLSTTSPSTISFSGGALAGGANCVILVTVTVTTAGPHLNVSGFVSATESGTNTGPDGSASDSITAISPPSISKLFNPNPILTGGTSTLTFTISNPNPDDALTGVAFSDTFPTSPGAMVVASPTGATTSGCGTPIYAPVAAAASISFTGGTIAAGGSCTVTVDVTATPTGDYANTSGTVSATTAGTGNTASDTLTVNPVNPGISILKQVGTSATGPWTTFVAVTAGTNIYYQMTVENIGDVALTSANVTDPTLTGLGVDLSGCAWSDLPLFDVQTCVVGPVTALVGSHANTATSHGTYISADNDSTPSTATYATTGLTLAKSVAESFYSVAGDTLNYSYLVTNSGSAPLAGPVVVSDDLSTDESCPDLSTVGDGDAFLDAGESITCTATYTITAGDVTAGSVTNTASATVDGVTSNEDSETVLINLPDMQVSKANDTSGSTAVGVAYNWTITISNPGPLAATFADTERIVRDPLPSGATYGAPSVGSITNVTNSGNISCSIDGSNVLTCDASGATVTIGATSGSFAVTVSVTPTAAGDLANTATVDPDDVINEGDETNNTDSDTVTAIGPPSIAKTFSPDSIAVGGTSSLGFTITNSNGGTALTGVAFSDSLPAGVTVVSASSAECGGTLTVTSPSLIALSGGSIAASSSCSFSVTVTGATVGSKNNTTGTVTSTNGGDGNTASDTLTVSAPVITDPAVTKAVSPSAAAVGDTVTFTIIVSNAGPADADDVELIDVIPAFLDISLVVTVPTPVSTSIVGNTITIDFGTVTPSDTYTVTITTVVNSLGSPPGGTNTADISTSSPESDTDNNSDSVPITIFIPSVPVMAPETGFAPNRRTRIPLQPASKMYETTGDMRLEIPALGVEMSVVGIAMDSEGWDVTWLGDQAGYLVGTAFPTWIGNSVIAGHTTLASGMDGPFSQLQELEYGDQIVIGAWGMRYIYEVREKDLVQPTDPSIFRHEERSWITLLTCESWDEQTQTYLTRRLVRAVLMEIEPMESETPGE
ncbi:MAG: DUF11 domain-containing protein [Chloroflexi bacterium]|nr:DUF11 domain-containing protein [Chloroflexota bacterium]